MAKVILHSNNKVSCNFTLFCVSADRQRLTEMITRLNNTLQELSAVLQGAASSSVVNQPSGKLAKHPKINLKVKKMPY